MSPQNPPPQSLKFRRGLIASAFGAVIIAGSLAGAQLKTNHQKEEIVQKFRNDNPAHIATLEEQRQYLVRQSTLLEHKMQAFQEKVRQRNEIQENHTK